MNNSNLEAILEDGLKALEYDDCFLVELKVNGNKIEVFIDSDDTVTFEKCRKISRYMEAVLDEEMWFGESYTLEVSSPGVGKPLKFRRQYLKNIGRTIEVKYGLSEKVKGTLTEVKEDNIVVEYKDRVKEGNKKKNIVVRVEVQFDEIRESKIKVRF